MSKGTLSEGRVAVCPTCGVEFIAKRVNQKYCSPDCRRKSADQKRYEREAEEKSLYEPNRHCKCCGKRLEGKQRKFCSLNCKNIYHSTQVNGVEFTADTITSKAEKCECTRKERCDYGINCSGGYICGYVLVEGHSRGNYPDGDKCEFFKEKKKHRKGKRWGNDLDNKWD